MATARDLLLVELLKLFNTAYTERSEQTLVKSLERFRVQAKSASASTHGTARELLIHDLKTLWLERPKADLADSILLVLSRYRMQLKPLEAKQGAKSRSKMLSQMSANGVTGEPVAGGPQRRQRIRGECPKCHSMGVVLARSYSGDEYCSCIYCGYQTYRAAMDLEFDLPMAAELLNRRFDEKEQNKDR